MSISNSSIFRNKFINNFTQNLNKNIPNIIFPSSDPITISNTSITSNKMLMRDYVERKLYFDNESYYTNSPTSSPRLSSPIGRLAEPLNFISMRGISDYARELNIKYPKSNWLTCSELLRPYFGYAIGNYILTNHLSNPKRKNIKIVEIGSGMGGAIDSILEYLKNFSVKDYKEVEYIGLEMTDSLSAHTTDLLKQNHPDLFNNKQITILNKSLFNYTGEAIDDECFVLAFNLIDSLGHDRVKFEKGFDKKYVSEVKEFYDLNKFDIKNKKGEDFKIFLNKFLNENKNLVKQSHVSELSDRTQITETYEEINDDLIKEMLFYHLLPYEEKCVILGQDFLKFEKNRIRENEEWFIKFLKKLFNYSGHGNNVWLPTNAIKFFTSVNKIFPNHKLILHDFDFLPSKIFRCDYRGRNSPAVYSIKENSYESITHSSIFSSYMTEKKPVNIYFPVDFDLIQIMYNLITGKAASINKFKYFMKEYSMDEWCETQSGFNPLTDTHHNLSFLLTLKK